jgi:hypothetical protein
MSDGLKYEKCTQKFNRRNLMPRDHLEDLDIAKTIILNVDFRIRV